MNNKIGSACSEAGGKSFVYMLVYPRSRVFKIGKADSIRNRAKALSLYRRDLDCETSFLGLGCTGRANSKARKDVLIEKPCESSSWSIEVVTKHVKSVESALLKSTEPASVRVAGDGGTEMRKIEVLSTALAVAKALDAEALFEGLTLTQGVRLRSLVAAESDERHRQKKEERAATAKAARERKLARQEADRAEAEAALNRAARARIKRLSRVLTLAPRLQARFSLEVSAPVKGTALAKLRSPQRISGKMYMILQQKLGVSTWRARRHAATESEGNGFWTIEFEVDLLPRPEVTIDYLFPRNRPRLHAELVAKLLELGEVLAATFPSRGEAKV